MYFAPKARFRTYGSGLSYLKMLRHFDEQPGAPDDPIARLEERACSVFGSPHAIAMPQDRVGIYLTVQALVRPGKKIILSPYTLSDVINMVICAGAVPVFADIDRTTANIDPDEIEALVDDDVDAVMVTHLHGLICEMDRIKAICARHKLALIEDAAQSCGARMDGTFAGAFGDAGIFSFGMYKNINSFYGGMVLARSDDTAQQIRQEIAEFPLQDPQVLMKKVVLGAATDLATHPLIFRSFTYWLFRYAYLNNIEFLNRRVRIEDDPQLKQTFPERYRNRMRPAQARLILQQFDDIDPFLEKRIEAARLYDQGLRGIPGLMVPPFHEDGRHSYLHYPIQLEDREALIRHMIKAGRDVAVQHLRDCSTLECFAEWHRPCPNSTATARQLTLLPTYPTYGAEQVRKNIEAIRDFFGVGPA